MLNASAIVCDDVHYQGQAPTHPERCAPRSLRTEINASILVGDSVEYLQLAPSTQRVLTQRLSPTTIFFRCAPQHPRHGLMTRVRRLTFSVEERNTQLLCYVGDEVNYLHFNRSSLRRRYELLRSFPDVMNADLYSHTL